MNAEEAICCSGCGRDLGLEPIGEDDAAECPDCHVKLVAFKDDAGALRDCPSCGGQLVEHAMLRELLERQANFPDLPAEARRQRLPELARVRYVPCPVCNALMNRKNFGTTSGVIVDVCKKHGLWLDAGELPRILAFARSGGLERARQRGEGKEAEGGAKHPAPPSSFTPVPVPAKDPYAPYLSDRDIEHGKDFLDTLFWLLR